MIYCIGIMLDAGLVLASDSRTHAGVDNFASFCKTSLFERAGDRVVILLNSGNFAGTQAVVGLLKQRNAREGVPNLWG
jgi:putative proteasome-type protease